MENLLIIAALAVIFIGVFRNKGVEFLAAFKESPFNMILFLGLSSLLVSFISIYNWISIIQYMREYGFFAPEVFDAHHNSINVMSFNSLYNYAIMTVFMLAGIIASPVAKTIAAKFILWSISGLYFLFILILYVTVISNKFPRDGLVAFTAFFTAVGVYALFMLKMSYRSKAKNWWLPAVFLLVILVITVAFPAIPKSIASNALQIAKIGGNISIDIYDKNLQKIKIDGKETPKSLLMRTNENIYITTNSNKDVYIIPSNEVVIHYNR